MSYLSIDSVACTTCQACIETCPARIIESGSDGLPYISTENETYCIDCFHCEAICPTDALKHAHSSNYQQGIAEVSPPMDAEQLSAYMQQRRSIREFLPEPIAREAISEAMEAVRFAPTATNSQLNQWIFVGDPKLVHRLAEGTVQWMRAVVQMAPEMAGKYDFPRLIEAWENGADPVCRHAPCLMLCATPKDYPIGEKDAAIATAHLELFLPSLGIGSCWAGFLMIALSQSAELRKLLPLEEGYCVNGALMVGYPKHHYPHSPARKPTKITWV